MRLGSNDVVAPEQFAPQDPPAAPEAAKYAQAATYATRRTADEVGGPVRVAYGSDPAQRLDIYAPAASAEKRPVLVFFHGGAWITGYLWWCGFMAGAAHKHGVILVAGTYRLAPQNRFPAQLEDVDLALEWVQRHIGEYGGEPRRIIVGGHSAGGHLAALSVLRGRPPRERGLLACFPVSSPLDVRYPDCKPGSPEERVYKFLLKNPADDAAASPITYAQQAQIPLHVTWGERDFDRILSSNERFSKALEQHRKPFSSQRVDGASHFDTHLALQNPASPWYQALRKAFEIAK